MLTARRRAPRAVLPAAVSLLAICVTGCSSDTTAPEACRYAVSQHLDGARFDAALERLATRECEASMSLDELEINRAAAYIGKAGYDVADLLLIVLEAGRNDSEHGIDVHLLESLSGLGAPGGGVRYAAAANEAYARMMYAFPGGVDEACRGADPQLLTRLQRDACFHSGLLGYARLARAFDLLLQHGLGAFLGLVPLDCDNDRNFSGVADEAEITACALHARTRLGEGGGICRAEGARQGLTRGAVSWALMPGMEDVPFYEGGQQFANLIPVAVTVQPGGICEGEKTSVRLLQSAPGMQMILTDGYCEAEITRSCAAADPSLGSCWPCPVPRAGQQGATSVTETLLSAINVEAERWLDVLNREDAANAEEDLEALRERLCEPDASAEDTSCDVTDEGDLRLTLEGLRDYLRR